MSQFTADDADPAEVRSALATLVATEPPLPSGTDDIERRGRIRLARRRVGTGMAAGVVAVVAASLALTSLGGLGGGSAPVAGPPPVDAASGVDPHSVDPGGAAGGAQLATGYPIGEAVNAVVTALPDGVTVGELPRDIGWQQGGKLDLPLVTTTGDATLTVAIVDGTCTATVSPAAVLTAADLDAVAGAVCEAWVAGGSLPVVPAGPPGPEQPDLAHQ